MLAPRPILLPSKRRDRTPVDVPVRAVAATIRLRNFRARLLLVPRARIRPSRGVNSSPLMAGARRQGDPPPRPCGKHGAEGAAREFRSKTLDCRRSLATYLSFARPCLARKRCADKHLAGPTRHCLYLAIPFLPPSSLPHPTNEKEQRRSNAVPPAEKAPSHRACLNALSASCLVLNAHRLVIARGIPSPSMIDVAANHWPSIRPTIATRSRSMSSSSALQ